MKNTKGRSEGPEYLEWCKIMVMTNEVTIPVPTYSHKLSSSLP